MKRTNFNYKGIELNYTSLLSMLQDGSFKTNYPNFQIEKADNCFIINDDDNYLIVIYLNAIEVIIEFDGVERPQEKFKINSNLDLENICIEKKISLDSLFFPIQNGILEHYDKNNSFPYFVNISDNKLNFISKQKGSLPEMKILGNFKKDATYKIKEFSSFYEDYFGELNPDSEFKYIESETRTQIFYNLYKLYSPGIKKYQITGPYSIGKSMTLLYFCRKKQYAFYLNLKIITKKPRKDAFSILMEEFSNVDKDIYSEIQKIINNNYYENLKPIETIVKIIEFFSLKKIRAIFVFDQHKIKYYSPYQYLYSLIINSGENVKLVFCSSINDHKIREECCKTWNSNYWTNGMMLNNKTQEYYFYYDKLYLKTIDKKDKLAKMFSGINKFMKYYKGLVPNDLLKRKNIDNIVIEHIIKKIKEFFEDKNITLDLVLTNMKNMINKTYEMSELNNLIKWFPLKYFLVQFIENRYFKIKMQFPFLKKIINKKLESEAIDSYFKEKKYLKSSIENETVKGDYFESSVKKGLKKNIKFSKVIENEVILEEISTMITKEGNNDDDDTYEDEDENDNNDSSSENMSIESEQNGNFDDPMDIITEDKYESKKIEDLLKEFSIDIKKEIKEEDNIEFYRKKVIEKLLKKKIIFPKVKYDGNLNYYIDQKKKSGRMLDYALLFGSKTEKTFVGFQIKCYFSKTETINDKFINKTKIKDACQNILLNSMTLFDCKITSWHYYLIFYYNKEKQEYNVNPLILSKCKDVVGILFYDPIEKIFYDVNYNPLHLLELDRVSDLDYIYSYYQMDILDINKIPKFGEIYNNTQLKDSFVKDFNFMGFNKVEDILEKIKKIMEIKGKLRLLHKSKYLSYFMNPPLRNRIILYKKKGEGFIGVKLIFNKADFKGVECYDLKNGILINDLNSKIDENYEYIYSLTMSRNYNQVKE